MHNFTKAKNHAINELWDMNKRAIKSTDNLNFNRREDIPTHQKNAFKNFVSSISDDEIIIISLLLILSEDCRDIWLFLALVYILL